MGLALPPHTFVYPACADPPWIMGRDPMKPCLPRMRGDPPEVCHCRQREKSLPRMRGDPPYHDHLHGDGNKSTPHARGSTVYRLKQITGIAVYPACAGIHPTGLPVSFACRSLPRMRGDPPAHPSGGIGYLSSTPHARGSTLHKNMMQKRLQSTPHARDPPSCRPKAGTI